MFRENMAGKSWKILNVFFLLVFLFISTCICLFHTEAPLGNDPYCPACKFKNSAIATAQIDIYQLPILEIIETLQLADEILYEAIAHPLLTARSPPLL
jgi:hypothetical protein